MIGATTWAIADGYIPAWSHGPEPEMASHESLSVLNTSPQEASLRLTIYFTDREPVVLRPQQVDDPTGWGDPSSGLMAILGSTTGGVTTEWGCGIVSGCFTMPGSLGLGGTSGLGCSAGG